MDPLSLKFECSHAAACILHTYLSGYQCTYIYYLECHIIIKTAEQGQNKINEFENCVDEKRNELVNLPGPRRSDGYTLSLHTENLDPVYTFYRVTSNIC